MKQKITAQNFHSRSLDYILPCSGRKVQIHLLPCACQLRVRRHQSPLTTVFIQKYKGSHATKINHVHRVRYTLEYHLPRLT